MALTIASREVDGVTVLDLSGRITLGEGSVQLREAVRDLISKGSKTILLNIVMGLIIVALKVAISH